jgi:RNA polymerase sigma factor (sigma-70 family)
MIDEEFATSLRALAKDKDLQRLARRLNPDADPNDTVQDVLLSLAKMPPETYANIHDLKSYAYKAVRNRSIELGIQKRRGPAFVALDKLDQNELTSGLDNPHDTYEQEQFWKRVHQRMDTFTPRERFVSRLLYLYGESTPETAQRLHWTLDVVRGARERATKKIKDFLNENEHRRNERPTGKNSPHVGSDREQASYWLVIIQAAQNITSGLHTFHSWLDAARAPPPDLARIKAIWRAMHNLRKNVLPR